MGPAQHDQRAAGQELPCSQLLTTSLHEALAGDAPLLLWRSTAASCCMGACVLLAHYVASTLLIRDARCFDTSALPWLYAQSAYRAASIAHVEHACILGPSYLFAC
jgi:hypothetical protein